MQVTLQGISGELTIATGKYDPIELGKMTEDDFCNLLQKLKHLHSPISQSLTQDICPPIVLVVSNNFTHSFEMTGGSILYSNSNSAVTEAEAVSIVFGNTYDSRSSLGSNISRSVMQWGSEHKDIRGLWPIRMHHIPPTDKIAVEASTIKTKSTPQIHEYIVKSRTSNTIHRAPLAFLLFSVALGCGAFAVEETVLGTICALVSFCLLWLSFYLKKKAKGLFTLGFDWSSNAIWAILDNQVRPTYIGNANCITALHVEKNKLSGDRWAVLGTIHTKYRDDYDVWSLLVEKTDGSKIPLYNFYTKEDAFNVYNKALLLLNQQN